MQWWAEGIIGVAQAAAVLGDDSLMAQLLEPAGENENIVVSWQKALSAAQGEARDGNYAAAIELLDDILDRTKELKGSAVDDLLPKTYGLLGTLYYSAGDINSARIYTLKAKEYCERIGDVEGVNVDRTNLQTIDAP